MYKCEIREDFETAWLENIMEVIEFHGRYVTGDMISLTLSDLRHLAEGKFLAWNVEDVYSQVLYLDEDAKEMLLSVESHLYNFQEISQKIMSGRLTRQNYYLLGKLIDEFHAVKAAMRVIETKRNDFNI
ncbi:Uncharacterised protein [Streptococcus pneumoniae]|uniref:Uncharacterized protein n=1 Tax=Streptococcus pneumoniae TaxID=1313 RepID=A0A4M6D2F0_STREE|nr:hypothetical protein [Streptococcus pneumoniae]EHD90188.1 hypothetical protein SPAR31_1377 [Streptococcus pneumoniae GA13494]EHE25189.1 hypothetical protein SPAR73_1305 [Streptococcus pneumoniae GA41565]EHE76919.1 hypothetical protein SPAR24_1283 [Streptococcus pneumoniae GA11663]EOB26694.1 hypothetical protein C944_08241 [Streptococcus pneumoniae 357]EPR95698.1 hypothetical protein M057_02235 [Streptococcus pneumoniae 1779n23_04]